MNGSAQRRPIAALGVGKRLIGACLRTVIRGYQLTISPVLGPRCRFWPSCSDYALQAIREHGPLAGVLLGSKRLLRCHPWCAGGFDPVPPAHNGPGCVRHRARCTCSQPSDPSVRRGWPDALRDGS